ncbi:MAG: hypothetical protein Q4C40_00575 [Eubacteriales bacterium]|nr:hypothetical protein [Eubacteriales bacterium]
MKKSYRITAGVLSALVACGALTPAMAASITKNETVYATLQPDGTVEHQTVSDWLHSDKGLNNFADVSDLEDITNVKGDETPSRNGSKLTWNINGNDVYYQGTSTGTMPIEAAITYTLDGKEVDASELEGASGHLVIKTVLKNNETRQVIVDGKEYTICKPYFTVIGTNLSTDHFSNVKAKDGKVETDSNNQIVGFLAMPGMKEIYGDLLGDEFTALTDMMLDEVTIECDMKDGEMPTLYFACAGNLNDLDADDLEMDDALDSLDELKDATQQLIDGSEELAEGCATLDEKLGELSSSYVAFHDGIIDATSGAGMLDDGAAQLASGMNTLSLGSTALADGVSKLDDGAKSVAAGAKQVDDGASNLSGGLNTLKKNSASLSEGSQQLVSGLNKLAASMGTDDMQKLLSGPSNISAGLDELSAGVAQFKEQLGALDLSGASNALDGVSSNASSLASGIRAQANSITTSGGLTAEESAALDQLAETNPGAAESIRAKVSDASGNAAAKQQLLALADGVEQLGGAAATVKSELNATVSTAMGNANAGLTKMQSGISDLKDGTSQLNGGMKNLVANLADATKQLQDGATRLDKGISSYTAGVSTAASGAATLAAGTSSLATGANSLAAGVDTLNGQVPGLTSGVNQLNEGASSLKGGADDLSAGMKTLQSASAQVLDAIHQFDEAGTQLADGAGELSDGIIQYNEEGISKITENENLTNLRTAAKLLDKQRALAKENTCYSGAPESATETSTKFIMRTAVVEEEEPEEVETEEVKEETLWDRIKGLF